MKKKFKRGQIVLIQNQVRAIVTKIYKNDSLPKGYIYEVIVPDKEGWYYQRVEERNLRPYGWGSS